MGAPLEICSKRSVFAVLASGVVISMTALTGGIAPAIADPKTEPVLPTTTTVIVPEPETIIPEETTQAEAEAPKPEVPPSAPVTTPAPPSVESPPETQAPEPATQTVAPTTAPVITPVGPASPTTAVDPPETSGRSARSTHHQRHHERIANGVGQLGTSVACAGRTDLGNDKRISCA